MADIFFYICELSVNVLEMTMKLLALAIEFKL